MVSVSSIVGLHWKEIGERWEISHRSLWRLNECRDLVCKLTNESASVLSADKSACVAVNRRLQAREMDSRVKVYYLGVGSMITIRADAVVDALWAVGACIMVTCNPVFRLLAVAATCWTILVELARLTVMD